MVILIFNREKVQQVWRSLLNFHPFKKISIKTIAAAIILMAVIFTIDQLLVNLFGHGNG